MGTLPNELLECIFGELSLGPITDATVLAQTRLALLQCTFVSRTFRHFALTCLLHKVQYDSGSGVDWLPKFLDSLYTSSSLPSWKGLNMYIHEFEFGLSGFYDKPDIDFESLNPLVRALHGPHHGVKSLILLHFDCSHTSSSLSVAISDLVHSPHLDSVDLTGCTIPITFFSGTRIKHLRICYTETADPKFNQTPKRKKSAKSRPSYPALESLHTDFSFTLLLQGPNSLTRNLKKPYIVVEDEKSIGKAIPIMKLASLEEITAELFVLSYKSLNPSLWPIQLSPSNQLRKLKVHFPFMAGDYSQIGNERTFDAFFFMMSGLRTPMPHLASIELDMNFEETFRNRRSDFMLPMMQDPRWHELDTRLFSSHRLLPCLLTVKVRMLAEIHPGRFDVEEYRKNAAEQLPGMLPALHQLVSDGGVEIHREIGGYAEESNEESDKESYEESDSG